MMKKALFFCAAALMMLFSLTSCHKGGEGLSSAEPQKKGSSGKTLEMLVVANKDVYAGDTKLLIDSLFSHPQDGLNQPEPIFSIVNIPISSFENTEMFHVHRNVLKCDINPENPNKVYKQIDLFAAPQVVFDFAVKDRQTLDSFLVKYAPMILDEMYKAEHRRIIKVFKNTAGVEVNSYIKKHMGFELTFSEEFAIAKSDVDFIWVRKETKDFGIGVFVQKIPYSNRNQFEESVILDQLDSIMKHNIPGSVEGSYMGTERRDFFYSRNLTMDGQYAVETRGLWRLFGPDFMGGPFVNYAVLTPDNKQVVMMTAYVYCPRHEKRDLLMQVESVCHSIRFNNPEK